MSLTLILIALTCVFSFIGFGNPGVVQRLILWPPAIARGGEWHRLVSYGLIHADPGHLLFNMITLYFFGTVMEPFIARYVGSAGYVAFYVAALVVSVLPTYLQHRNDPNYRSLGASGAVSAVLFAFILLQPWATIYVFVVPVPAIIFAALYVAYSIWMDRRGKDNVNHSAHLWGAAFGVVFMIALDARVLPVFLDRLTNP